MLFSLKSYSQNVSVRELNGSWVNYKIEMKDGSKLIDRYYKDSSYVNFLFNKNQLCTFNDPIYKEKNSCITFTKTNNYLKTSEFAGYLIEQIKKDTLIISEKINDLESNKLKRFYFVREQNNFNEFEKQQEGTTNHIANQFYTPTLKSSLILQLNNAFKRKHSNFKVKGEIIIDIKNKNVTSTILHASTSDSTKIKRVLSVLDSSFNLWDTKLFKEIETIKIPFAMKDVKTKTYRGISIIYFTNSYKKLDEMYGDSIDKIRKAKNIFDKGLISYQKKEFDKAIELFNKSYSLDPVNIDALYNIATIYYEIGNREKACSNWQKLSDLGQVQGNNLLKNYCSN